MILAGYSKKDIQQLQQHNINVFLIGESMMKGATFCFIIHLFLRTDLKKTVLVYENGENTSSTNKTVNALANTGNIPSIIKTNHYKKLNEYANAHQFEC